MGSGYLVRFTKTIEMPITGVGNWAVYYHPSDDNIYLDESAALGTSWTSSSTPAPGNTFFSSLASGFRPVAACMEYLYSGTESNRSGLCVFTNKLAKREMPSNLSDPSDLHTIIPNSTRVPPATLVVNYLPDLQAKVYRLVGTALTDTEANRMTNGLCISVTNGGVSTGQHRIKITAVFEWTPKLGTDSAALGMNAVRPPTDYEVLVSRLTSSAMTFVASGGLRTASEMLQNYGGMALDFMRRS
jgi:hypothetical protein